jgi:nucleotide-binding universal stress UspA family protein
MNAVVHPGPTGGAQQGRTEGPGDGGPRVVVDVDGSPSARAALVMALTEAAGRGAVLDVVSAFPVNLVWTGGVPLEVPDVEAVRGDTERRAREIVEDVLRQESLTAVPGVAPVDVRVFAMEGRPVSVLLTTAEGADLLVVGSRGRGGMRSALLGSVALHCVSHAPCPVIVVHGGAPASSPPTRVVVGVDGSETSRAVVIAAVEEAARAGADVEVIVCYVLADSWTDLTTVITPTVEQIRDDLLRHTEALVMGIVAQREDEDSAVPAIRMHAVEGPAGDVFVQWSRDAALLVVGSRGRGAVRGLVLGSVALHCAMHALGPVMVVHPHPARSAVARPQPERVLADR